MRDYVICIDASVDIEQHWIDDNGVIIIPMKYTLGEQEYLMENRLTDLKLKEFYDAMRAGQITHTSQITPYYYQQIFGKEAQKGHDILYISLSSGLSNTYSSALTAAGEIEDEYEGTKIEVVDSLAGTGGMGLLLMMAVRAKQNGVSLSENAAALRANAGKVCHWFMVDDLKYLRRGGRISAATAVAGTVLNIKECYSGALDASISNDVVISHADCEKEAEAARERILAFNPDARVMICGLGPVIGAHTGPGMMAVIHWGNRNFV